jgi:hypothetical protein
MVSNLENTGNKQNNSNKQYSNNITEKFNLFKDISIHDTNVLIEISQKVAELLINDHVSVDIISRLHFDFMSISQNVNGVSDDGWKNYLTVIGLIPSRISIYVAKHNRGNLRYGNGIIILLQNIIKQISQPTDVIAIERFFSAVSGFAKVVALESRSVVSHFNEKPRYSDSSNRDGNNRDRNRSNKPNNERNNGGDRKRDREAGNSASNRSRSNKSYSADHATKVHIEKGEDTLGVTLGDALAAKNESVKNNKS